MGCITNIVWSRRRREVRSSIFAEDRPNAAVFKIDHNISLGQALTLRYNYGDGYNGNTETWSGLVAESPSGPSTRTRSGLPAESKCRRRPLELDTHLVHCTRY
jgi:hypothetical protein